MRKNNFEIFLDGSLVLVADFMVGEDLPFVLDGLADEVGLTVGGTVLGGLVGLTVTIRTSTSSSMIGGKSNEAETLLATESPQQPSQTQSSATFCTKSS